MMKIKLVRVNYRTLAVKLGQELNNGGSYIEVPGIVPTQKLYTVFNG